LRRSALVRALTFALAFVHTFPAKKHVLAFAAAPSWSEGWKVFGAIVAIGLYLLPVSVQSRGLTRLWQERRAWLRAAAITLAAAHLVPASDHLPRFWHEPSWADAWRGGGSALAVLWFLAPMRAQARVISLLGRLAQLAPATFATLHHAGPAPHTGEST
jgi:phosphatidylglycerophosphate synthase